MASVDRRRRAAERFLATIPLDANDLLQSLHDDPLSPVLSPLGGSVSAVPLLEDASNTCGDATATGTAPDELSSPSRAAARDERSKRRLAAAVAFLSGISLTASDHGGLWPSVPPTVDEIHAVPAASEQLHAPADGRHLSSDDGSDVDVEHRLELAAEEAEGSLLMHHSLSAHSIASPKSAASRGLLGSTPARTATEGAVSDGDSLALVSPHNIAHAAEDVLAARRMAGVMWMSATPPPPEDKTEWERLQLARGLLHARVLLCHEPLSVPAMVCSYVPFRSKAAPDKEGALAAPHKKVLFGIPNHARIAYSPVNGKPRVSYKYLLRAPDDDDAAADTGIEYDPQYLEGVQSGRNRVVMNLAGYMSSTISFVRRRELKKELNKKFRLKHEWLNPTMSLSKIRKLKTLLTEVGVALDMEMSTVAMAFVYLERLVLANLVRKANRKLAAAVCMLLAFKFNEYNMLAEVKHVAMEDFVDEVCETFDVKRRELLKNEFVVFAHLGFSLTARPEHVQHHFNQIINSLDVGHKVYTGDGHWVDIARPQDEVEDSALKHSLLRRKVERRRLRGLGDSGSRGRTREADGSDRDGNGSDNDVGSSSGSSSSRERERERERREDEITNIS